MLCWKIFPLSVVRLAEHLQSCLHVYKQLKGNISNVGKQFYLSASSRMIILCRPGGSVTFFCAKALILFRTTSIPLNYIRDGF